MNSDESLDWQFRQASSRIVVGQAFPWWGCSLPGSLIMIGASGNEYEHQSRHTSAGHSYLAERK